VARKGGAAGPIGVNIHLVFLDVLIGALVGVRPLMDSSMAWPLPKRLLMGKQNFWVSAGAESAVPRVHWIEVSQHIIFREDFFLASEGSCMCKLILRMFDINDSLLEPYHYSHSENLLV